MQPQPVQMTEGLRALYRAAFPDEDLLPLLQALSQTPDTIAFCEGCAPFGHCVFTQGQIGTAKVALLGPVAVLPEAQRQGLGSALIRAGLRHLQDAGFAYALVLGDPAYYGRFGFQPDCPASPPYPIPAEWAAAWQWLALGQDQTPPHGTLILPAAWRDPALWAA